MSGMVIGISAGVVCGAAASAVVWFLSAFFIKRRGLDSRMERRHLAVMIPCLAVCGGVIGWRTGLTLHGLYLVLLMIAAACVFYIDALHRVIPNELVLAILALAAGFGLTGIVPFDIVSSLLAMAACFVVFFLPAAFGQKIGAGDVKLAAAMGFALGLTKSLYAVAGMGVLVLIYVFFARGMPFAERMKSLIPMGPFLALALVIVSLL